MSPTVWSIGHSNVSIERFLDLLHAYDIAVVADVRSSPTSRFTPHFGKDQLQRHLEMAGLRYVFMGRELGGRPVDPQMYEADGRARYDLMARSDLFRSGLERLTRGVAQYRVAVTCSEEDPMSCHRRRLVGRVLADERIEMLHIRGDGRIETEAVLRVRESTEHPDRFQLGWLDEAPWTSIHPVRSTG